MKLLMCFKCSDIVKLTGLLYWRGCRCGAVQARYLKDGLHAEITGEGCLLAFDNGSFYKAIQQYKSTKGNIGNEFTSFVISDTSEHVKRLG
jgi:hypothetical protein